MLPLGSICIGCVKFQAIFTKMNEIWASFKLPKSPKMRNMGEKGTILFDSKVIMKILATVGFTTVGDLDRPMTQRWRGWGVPLCFEIWNKNSGSLSNWIWNDCNTDFDFKYFVYFMIKLFWVSISGKSILFLTLK